MRYLVGGLAVLVIALLAVWLLRSGDLSALEETPGAVDFSGLAWLEGDAFLTVHDAKIPAESARPRVGVATLSRTLEGIRWRPLEVSWPTGAGMSHDLESIARIPGTTTYLLFESGDDGSEYRRIYVAEAAGGEVRIREAAEWPVPITNVEGSAVARLGSGYLFLYAERAHGSGTTQIAYAPLSLNPLAFGSFDSVTFQSPDPEGPGARPVSALEVDSRGRLYVASALDLDRDDGPFRSVVWEAGRVVADEAGTPRIVLLPTPRRLATLDGLKVESIAVREHPSGDVEVFAGTDDENNGGVIRPLPHHVRMTPVD